MKKKKKGGKRKGINGRSYAFFHPASRDPAPCFQGFTGEAWPHGCRVPSDMVKLKVLSEVGKEGAVSV